MASKSSDSGETLNWGAKAALICCGPLSAYVFGGLVPILPHIQQAFADTPGSGPLVRFLVSGIGISMIVGGPLAGIAAARFGRRNVLLVSLVVYAVFGVLGGMLDNLWLMIACRLLFGLGAAGCGTMLISLVAGMPEAQRNRWLGLNTTLGTAATFVLIPLAGFLGAMSWRYPFYVHAFAVIVIAFTLVGFPAQSRPATKAEAASTKTSKPGLPLFLMGVALVAGMLTSVFQLFAPFHLRDIGVADPAQVGVLVMTAAIATGICSFFYANIRRRLSMRGTFVASLAVTAVGLTIIGLSPTPAVFLAGMMIAGIGTGILAPHFYGLASVTGTPDEAPRNIGFARAGYYSGPLVSQIALEPVVGAASAGAAIVVLATLGAVAAATISRVRVPYRQATV